MLPFIMRMKDSSLDIFFNEIKKQREDAKSRKE